MIFILVNVTRIFPWSHSFDSSMADCLLKMLCVALFLLIVLIVIFFSFVLVKLWLH